MAATLRATEFINVVVCFMDKCDLMRCKSSATVGEVISEWQKRRGNEGSFSFVAVKTGCLLENMTLGEVQEAEKTRTLDLDAVVKRTLSAHIFGFEESKVDIDVSLSMTPSLLKESLRRTFHLRTKNFRLKNSDKILVNDLSLDYQEVKDGDIIDIDIKVPLKIHFQSSEESDLVLNFYSSEHLISVREHLNLDDQQVFVITNPRRRLVPDSLTIAHLVGSEDDLQEGPVLFIESPTELTFEPLGLEDTRKGVAVHLSSLPYDLYDELITAFELITTCDLKNNFRLCVDGEPLNAAKTLIEQGVDARTVIELDFMVEHRIKNLNRINIQKVVVSNKKRLSVHRLAPNAVFTDLSASIRQAMGHSAFDMTLRKGRIDDLNERITISEGEIVQVSDVNVTVKVTVKGVEYNCPFQPPSISYTDIMNSMAKLTCLRATQRPKLFCVGCGRCLSAEEEEFQPIPSQCCRVKSLQLSDRRVRDVGTQTAKRRCALGQMEPIEGFQMTSSTDMNGCIRTKSDEVGTPQFRSSAAGVQFPPLQQHLWLSVMDPHQHKEEVTVRAATAEEVLERALPLPQEVPLTGTAAVIARERRYASDRAERLAMECFDPDKRKYDYIDCEDGRVVLRNLETFFIWRFLRPSAPLPTSPRFLPHLRICTDVVWLQVGRNRQLERAGDGAVNNPAFLVMLWGIRCLEKQQKGEDFWECVHSGFVSAGTGRKLWVTNLPAGRRERFYCLLRNSDLIPRTKVPKGDSLVVFRRPGVALRIESGRLRAEAPSHLPDLERWQTPFNISQFERNLSAAARKKRLPQPLNPHRSSL